MYYSTVEGAVAAQRSVCWPLDCTCPSHSWKIFYPENAKKDPTTSEDVWIFQIFLSTIQTYLFPGPRMHFAKHDSITNTSPLKIR